MNKQLDLLTNDVTTLKSEIKQLKFQLQKLENFLHVLLETVNKLENNELE